MASGRYPRGFYVYLARAEAVELLRYLIEHPDSTRWQIMTDTTLSKSDVARLVPQLHNKGIITAKDYHTKKYSISEKYLPPLMQDIIGGGS